MTSLSARSTRLSSRVAFVLAVAIQLLALYAPRVEVPGGADVPGSDKAVHALVFALVMITGVLTGLPARWLALVLVAHAGLSELVQHVLLPGRTGDALDAVADVAGVTLGWYLATVVRRHGSAGAPGPDQRRRG